MPGEGDDTRAFTARLPAAEYEALRNLAFFQGTSMADLLAKAVRALLAEAAREEDIDALVERTRTRLRDTLDRLGRLE